MAQSRRKAFAGSGGVRDFGDFPFVHGAQQDRDVFERDFGQPSAVLLAAHAQDDAQPVEHGLGVGCTPAATADLGQQPDGRVVGNGPPIESRLFHELVNRVALLSCELLHGALVVTVDYC